MLHSLQLSLIFLSIFCGRIYRLLRDLLMVYLGENSTRGAILEYKYVKNSRTILVYLYLKCGRVWVFPRYVLILFLDQTTTTSTIFEYPYENDRMYRLLAPCINYVLGFMYVQYFFHIFHSFSCSMPTHYPGQLPLGLKTNACYNDLHTMSLLRNIY